MVPFMAGQSLAMGEAFGKGFQYGKRKISSMSNEDFNALDFQQLAESIHTDYKVMIPSLKRSIEESKELQDAVFAALGKLILEIPPAILNFFAEATGTTTQTSASNLGSELSQVRLDLGQGFRREDPRTRQEGPSLFERDQLVIREKALAKALEEAKQALLKQRETPTPQQRGTTISPSFAASLTRSDLNRGGHRTRSTRQGLIQWTGTHQILSAGTDKWSIRIWKNNGWSPVSSFTGGTTRLFAEGNKLKIRMGSSYVLQTGSGRTLRLFLISDGHVKGFK